MTTRAQTPRVARAVHLIWMQGADAMPPKYASSLELWRRLHPTWEVRLWSEAEIRALAAERYPRWARLVDPALVPALIDRADVGRTLILHAHGGVYADLDYLPNRPLDPLLAEQEAAAAARGWPDLVVAPGSAVQGVTNCVLISSAGAAFWPDVFWPRVAAALGGPRGLDALLVALAPPWSTLVFAGPVALARAVKLGRVVVTPRGVLHSNGARAYGAHLNHSGWSSLSAWYIRPLILLAALAVLVVLARRGRGASPR